MSGVPPGIRRISVHLVVATLVAAMGLNWDSLGRGGNVAPALPGGRATDMAALAPQLVAKQGADPVTGAASQQPACTNATLPGADAVLARPDRPVSVAHDGAAVQIGAGAVHGATKITAESLCASGLAPMNQGMANVTAGPRRGYRFLPHMTFAANLRITLPYDPNLFPAGESAQDLRTRLLRRQAEEVARAAAGIGRSESPHGHQPHQSLHRLRERHDHGAGPPRGSEQ